MIIHICYFVLGFYAGVIALALVSGGPVNRSRIRVVSPGTVVFEENGLRLLGFTFNTHGAEMTPTAAVHAVVDYLLHTDGGREAPVRLQDERAAELETYLWLDLCKESH